MPVPMIAADPMNRRLVINMKAHFSALQRPGASGLPLDATKSRVFFGFLVCGIIGPFLSDTAG
jgi:hypothetical protein